MSASEINLLQLRNNENQPIIQKVDYVSIVHKPNTNLPSLDVTPMVAANYYSNKRQNPFDRFTNKEKNNIKKSRVTELQQYGSHEQLTGKVGSTENDTNHTNAGHFSKRNKSLATLGYLNSDIDPRGSQSKNTEFDEFWNSNDMRASPSIDSSNRRKHSQQTIQDKSILMRQLENSRTNTYRLKKV